jgi:predicted enzyme related to lactoylglutathione lyase
VEVPETPGQTTQTPACHVPGTAHPNPSLLSAQTSDKREGLPKPKKVVDFENSRSTTFRKTIHGGLKTMSQTAQLDDPRTSYALAQGKTFVWHQIFGASSQTSLDFYTEALDWGVDEMPMGEMGAYKMLTVNGTPVAGVIGTEEGCAEAQGTPPHWSVSIAVDDVDARAEKCQSLGGKLLHGPMDIPTVGRIALTQDPQGATFWLFKGEGC